MYSPKLDRNETALSLPIVATYNLRSLFPKVNSLKTDILERNIDVAFLQEIWEDSGNEKYQKEVEKMYELDGLKYVSTPQLKGTAKAAYGGAGLIVNTSKFSHIDPNIQVPDGLEVKWAIVKPKNQISKFKKTNSVFFLLSTKQRKIYKTCRLPYFNTAYAVYEIS